MGDTKFQYNKIPKDYIYFVINLNYFYTVFVVSNLFA